MMKNNIWFAMGLCFMLALLFLASSCSGDDDDDSASLDDDSTDDDAGDDDAGDDDAGDDDTGDDDTADDDIVDDDTSDDDTSDDDTGDDDTADDDVGEFPFSIDFESYALGDLPSPWQVIEAGATTFEVMELALDKYSGHGLELSAGKLLADSGNAKYPLPAGVTGTIDVSFDVWMEANATFTFVIGSGSTEEYVPAAYIVVDSKVGKLYAYDYSTEPPTGTDCGAFPTETPMNIFVECDGNASTYSINVTGWPATCELQNLQTPGSAFVDINFGDGAGLAAGGISRFDNFAGDYGL